MKLPADLWPFVKKITLIHVVTYVVFGVVFLLVAQIYQRPYAESALAGYLRATDDPLLMFAPLAQIPRGAIIALILYPLRPLIAQKNGWLWLWLWLVGAWLIAPPSGLIEDLFYKQPEIVQLNLLGLPEVLLQMLAFAGAVWYRMKGEDLLENAHA